MKRLVDYCWSRVLVRLEMTRLRGRRRVAVAYFGFDVRRRGLGRRRLREHTSGKAVVGHYRHLGLVRCRALRRVALGKRIRVIRTTGARRGRRPFVVAVVRLVLVVEIGRQLRARWFHVREHLSRLLLHPDVIHLRRGTRGVDRAIGVD